MDPRTLAPVLASGTLLTVGSSLLVVSAVAPSLDGSLFSLLLSAFEDPVLGADPEEFGEEPNVC